MRGLGPLAIVLTCASGPTLAAQAPVVNAAFERRTAVQSVSGEVEAVAKRGLAAWVGYRVPLARRDTGAFETTGTCCGRCRLEPPTDLVVLARVEQGAIVQLRAVAVDCDIDAAGMALVWLDGVNPDDSVAWLRSIVQASPAASRRLWAAALTALAHHAAPGAVSSLSDIAHTHPDREVRRQAMIRLGQSRDPRAAELLSEILLK